MIVGGSRSEDTLVGVLGSRAERTPKGLAYEFVDKGKTVAQLDYSELDRKARTVGAYLRARGCKPGDRIMLIYPPGLEYIVAFLGCLYAGCVAIPSYPPSRSRSNNNIAHLDRITHVSGTTLVLATRSALDLVTQLRESAPHLSRVPWIALEDVLVENIADSWVRPERCGDDLAFLQYTSGSTGNPKGVMVSHGNIMHNARTIHRAFGITEATQGFSWLPPYHDMGLIGGILTPLVSGVPCALMTPLSFAANPFRWLEGVSRVRADISGGPNFAYDLCVDTIKDEQLEQLDLSSWKIAFTGAEAVRQGTLERFARKFERCGFRKEAFYPCYGLAESTLMVSGGIRGQGAKTLWARLESLSRNRVERMDPGSSEAQAIVSCGTNLPGQVLKIVDPETLLPLPEGQVGEIWARSESVAKGYYGDPELTAISFHAKLAGSPPESSDETFLRTGDLGCLVSGDLYILGRLKDLIIIRGRNYHPVDLESIATKAAPALIAGGVAAFSVETEAGEGVVIVAEVDPRVDSPEETARRISEAIAEEADLRLHEIVQIKARTAPRTTSGKIRRSTAKAEYLDQKLQIVHRTSQASVAPETEEPKPAQKTVFEIEKRIIDRIARTLRKDPSLIRPGDSFSSMGLVSLDAVRLSAELSEWLGKELPATLFYDVPNAASLARYLSGQDERVVTERAGKRSVEREPIAVVGMSCRFPGGHGLEEFWKTLEGGVDAIREVPSDRWSLDQYYSPTPERGKMSARAGGFIDGIDLFGAEFFQTLPLEAGKIDPQQRLLLEVTAEALEHAGIPHEKLAGSRTGVFVGVSGMDYAMLMNREGPDPDLYAATGNSHSISANRISYWLDLRGPSIAIDTACSSSLMAIHLACQSLSRGECNLAVAGGANLILDPGLSIGFSQAHLLSPGSRCRAFSDQADGFARGEGAGVLILKRLSEAVESGDRILAVVAGSGANQDGKTNGITAPSGKAQIEVIRSALESANLQPHQISYLEAHGTGTKLGDPIEYQALSKVFSDRAGQGPLYVGSTKTNIGHLEAAAGVAGVIRTILSLVNKRIPKHLHFERLSTAIAEPSRSIEFAGAASIEWKQANGPRRAGVSSFGFGGTNVHLILEEAPPAKAPEVRPSSRPEVLCLSAPDLMSLKELTDSYLHALGTHLSQVPLGELCSAAREGRSRFSHGLAIPGNSVEEIRARLSGYKENLKSKLFSGAKLPAPRRRLVFMFSGQGSQGAAMGEELYRSEPVFRNAIDRCSDILRPLLGRDLVTLLYPGTELAVPDPGTHLVQPALFALEYALSELWRSWGIVPDAVIGHSLGELVAACVAGAYTLEDGLKLVAERGRLMQSTSSDAAMAVVFAGRESLLRPLAECGVELGAENAPDLCTVSGTQERIEKLLALLAERGIRAKRLSVSRAFHSRLMDPILDEFEKIASSIPSQPLKLPLASNLYGKLFRPGAVLDGKYWRSQLRSATLFHSGITELISEGYGAFLELGPAPVLVPMARRLSEQANWLHSLQPGEGSLEQMSLCAGALHILGFNVDWKARGGVAARPIALPYTPYQKKSYWFKSRTQPLEARSVPMAEMKQGPASAEASGDQLLRSVCERLAPLVGVEATDLDVDLPLVEMGADSLLLLRAIQILEDSFGIKLTVTQLFREVPTVRALAEYIKSRSSTAAPGLRVEVEEAPAAAAASIMAAPAAPRTGAALARFEAALSHPSLPPLGVSSGKAVSGSYEKLMEEQLRIMAEQLKVLASLARGSEVPTSVQPTAPSVPAQAPKPAPAQSKTPDRFAAFMPKSKEKERLDSGKQQHLEKFISHYNQKTAGSKRLAQAFRTHLSDCRAVAGFRPNLKELVYPIVGARSDGARIWDIDGNEYVDFTMGFGVSLFGHNPPFLNEAIEKQLRAGFQIGPQTELAGQVADLFCEMTGLDRVTFCNSGTEAVMTAVRIARATTKRDPIVIFDGSYHGTFDGFLGRSGGAGGASVPVAPGITRNLVGDLIVLEYGSDSALEYLRANSGKLAAVIVEPVQARHPDLQPVEFLRELRKLTRETGTALVFDETITGFRAAPGGAQEHFGVQADIATYGKILGGGLPIGAIGGSARFMDCIDGGFWKFGDDSFPEVDLTFFAGTFCKHPLTMAASLATLRHLKLKGADLQDGLARMTERLARTLNQVFEAEGYPIKVVHFRSLFRFEFPGNMDLLFYHLMDKGIFIWEGRNCFVSTAHTEADIDRLIAATQEALLEMRQAGFLPAGERPKIDPLTERFSRLYLESPSRSGAAQITIGIEAEGKLDVQTLRDALSKLIQRHESLRTRFDVKAGTWKVESTVPPALEEERLGPELSENQKQDWLRLQAGAAIDPAQVPQLRARVAKLSDDRHLIAVQVSHLACDGFGAVIALGEWLEIYSSLKTGNAIVLAPPVGLLTLQKQELARQSESMTLDRDYWKKTLSGSADLVLPGRSPTSSGSPGSALELQTVIESSKAQTLKDLCRKNRSTLFQLLLTAFVESLHRATGQEDLVVGVAYSNREAPGSEFQVSNRINILPIRLKWQRGASLESKLAQIKDALLAAYARGTYPYVHLCRDLGIRPVQAVFNFEPFSGMPPVEGLKTRLLGCPASGAEFDWYVNVLAIEGMLKIDLIADASVCDRKATLAWLESYRAVLEGLQ